MFLVSRGRPARKADNLATICEPTVQTMWDPQQLTILWVSKACYGDSFTLSYFLLQLTEFWIFLMLRGWDYWKQSLNQLMMKRVLTN
jgi:hypothetical protein